MQVEIQFVEHCPNTAELVDRVRNFAETRRDLTLSLTLVKPGEAVPRGFAGSPTVLIDGRDPFEGTPVTTAACALHPPNADQVVSALQSE